jgi:UDP-glucose 4-epimerase
VSALKEERVLVVGGAGFIGSHLCGKLASLNSRLTILDNLSTGHNEHLAAILQKYKGNMKFLKGDCTKPLDVRKAIRDVDVIIHLAANPEVRLELNDPKVCFRQNVYATYVLMEVLRRARCVRSLVFASSSTVYGDASDFPTSESYGPLKPISTYGASKLASEALISSYTYTYGLNSTILRLANVIGPGSHHGVIPDFISKLRKNKRQLEILGDGTQCKSYLYIDDCVDAILRVSEESNSQVEIFNVGSEDWTTVSRIAEIVVEELGLEKVNFAFTGGLDGGRGWKGDVKKMLLDVSRLKALGWKPMYKSEEAVRQTTKRVLAKSDWH